MHVVWKRPDGFHGATPADFHTIGLAGHSKLWLHKTDHDNYPFRISGGWRESEASSKLNNLVNLINQPEEQWITFLTKLYDHSMADKPDVFFSDLESWLSDLKENVRGDTWEIDIMSQAISVVETQMANIKTKFLSKVK